MTHETIDITISTPFITLDALLKWANVVESGGQAKQLIADGEVSVNGEVEFRRGRKLRAGDRVTMVGLDSELVVVTET